MADIDYDKMAEAVRRGTQGTGGGYDASAFSKLNSKVKDTTDGFDPFSRGMGAAKDAFNSIKETINSSINTWQKLSGTGANFNNDIVGMNVAAAGSRLSLADFSDVIVKNAQNLGGLGTSINQSTLAFSKTSKEMFDSGITDQLRTMGLSTKDINEALVMQMSIQKSSFKDDAEGRRKAYESAVGLATEMDLISKMTGKSRAAQEEEIKKAGVESSVRAKFLLLEEEDRRNGTNKAAEAKLMYEKEYARASAMGLGQNFKEIFATGHVVTQEAANNQAVLGDQAVQVGKQALATADGNRAAADEAHKRAMVGQEANLRDESKLRITTFGEAGGAMSKVMSKQLDAGYEQTQALAKIRQEKGMENLTKEQLIDEQQRRLKLEQAGRDKDGNLIAGAGTTKAVVQLQARIGDVNSALMTGMVKPLNEKVGPAFNKFAETTLSGTVDRKTASGKVETVGAGRAYTETLGREFTNALEGGRKGASTKEMLKGRLNEQYAGSDLLGGAGEIGGGIANAAITGFGKLSNSSIFTPANDKQQNKPSTTAPTSTVDTIVKAPSATLDDVVDKLDQLNKNMSNVATHTETLNDTAAKQVRATNNQSGKRY
jgi:hypothetical protein